MKKSVLLTIVLITFVIPGIFASTLTLWPNGQGYYSGWTNSGCSSGTSEWQCVDEDPANTTDNLYTSSKNVYESFAFSNTGLSGATINSVTLYFYGQYYSSSRYQFQPLIRVSGTNYLGSLKNTTSSYDYYSEVYTTNPATGNPWNVSQVDALEAGMKSYSANQGGRIAQVYAVVDYSLPDSCSDTDGGNFKNIFGTASGYLNESSYSDSDYCVDSSNVMEYYCSGTSKQSEQQSCGTDGYTGNNYCLLGDVYKNYTDYYCVAGGCSSNVTFILQQDCVSGQYCSAGQCLWNDSCSDTDGGNYKNIFGTASGYFNNIFYSDDDYCVDESYIMEYFCLGNYKNSSEQSCGTDNYTGSRYCLEGDAYRNYTDYYCASGACSSNVSFILQQDCVSGQYCSAGYCYWNDSCSDSDGGINITVFGTVSGYKYIYYNYNDTCFNSTTLIERYCNGTNQVNSTYSCIGIGTGVCSSGACI